MKYWILSYPKSGSNWLSYCIEHLTGERVNGHQEERHKDGDQWLFQKTHNPGMTKYDEGLIVIVRNFRDCITSFGLGKGDVNEFFLDQYSSYMQVIERYDRHQGKKAMIYYEDLLERPEPQLRYLCLFTGHKFDGDFISHLGVHKQNSYDLYKRVFVKHVQGVENNQWDEVAKKHPLFNKYLKRYVY